MTVSYNGCPWTQVFVTGVSHLLPAPLLVIIQQGVTRLNRIYINLHVSLGEAAASGSLLESSLLFRHCSNLTKCCCRMSMLKSVHPVEGLKLTHFTYMYEHDHASPAVEGCFCWQEHIQGNKSALWSQRRAFKENRVLSPTCTTEPSHDEMLHWLTESNSINLKTKTKKTDRRY